MIDKKTIIHYIGITCDGTVEVRFAMLLIEDGIEISKQFHRRVINPGDDVDAHISVVNAAAEKMKASSVDEDRLPLLRSICALAHTPDVVDGYRAKAAAEAPDTNR